AARLLLQAAYQQAVPGGPFEGTDRAVGMSERRGGGAPHGRELRSRAASGRDVSRHFRRQEFLPGDSGPGPGDGASDSSRLVPTGKGARPFAGSDQRQPLPV